MSAQGSSSGSRGSGRHVDSPPQRQTPGPKLQVQRSHSRDTITIHFSALGKEEDDDEDELYLPKTTEKSVTAGLEAKEEFQFEQIAEEPPSSASAAMTITSSQSHHSSIAASTSSSWPSEKPLASPATSSHTSSPCKSTALSSSKPFLSLVRSLSNDVESRDPPPVPTTVAPTHARHRHLMKSFVKSLSTDASKDQEGSHPYQHAPPSRPPPRNMQLFKQFSQPRLSTAPVVVTQAGGDSKTAPSSPIMSPDGRSFFKVQEVEAKIEDTKRRLSEVMSDPMQLFSKIIGDESGGMGASGGGVGHRGKSLSSSASELSGVAALNGHSDANSSYSIKEESAEAEEDDEETPIGKPPDSVFFHSRLCQRSRLARQEDEEFCELYSEDFDICTDTETPDGSQSISRHPQTVSMQHSELDLEEEDGYEAESIPVTGLIFLTQLVYWYLILPLPPYVYSVIHGVMAGFVLALLVLWLSAPRISSCGMRRGRRRTDNWNVAQLDIKDPEIFKGWMNEISNYDPEMYHATLTHSVYVRLEGSVLRLSKPNRNISRRAAHNEPKPDVTYISQKIYDLTNSKIYLMPQSLARKRVWNKKYPICIELAKQDDFLSKAQGDRAESGEDRPAVSCEKMEKVEKPEGSSEEPKRPSSGGGDLTIYLFGRTGREKEEWFRRFLLVSRIKLESRPPAVSKSGETHATPCLEPESRSSSRGSLEEVVQAQGRSKDPLTTTQPCPTSAAKQKMLLDYNVYMAKYVTTQAPPRSPTGKDSSGNSPESSPKAARKRGSEASPEPEAWVNAFLGRIFWDFLGEKYWADVVSKKIQMKLSKIRLPYVMNELTLTELDMGCSIPKILHASKPSVDHQGLWFDLEIMYTGSFLMTLETKMNLARLGKEGEGLGEQGKEWPRPRTYCLADSDEESSSAGSSDEEEPPELLSDKTILPGAEGYVGGHRPSKIMRFVDKIAKSKYFQKATETEFIKKKMEEVSNTPLLLTVEVQDCKGTLAVNIPPPPTDRIWYGFRTPPHLELKARPKLGEREVTLGHVTDWIEKKLNQEFQKIFVMPNMDDVWLPIMHSAMDMRSNVNLVTVRNDALKDPELSESEVSDLGT
uniref:Testis expressed 2 n=1 Tax=Neogobius melanostomus TaxID=47308 RepID=A0A8C6TNU1_9GOBI